VSKISRHDILFHLNRRLLNGDEVLPIIEYVKSKLKEAVLKPKLNKNSLEYEEYTNFRPISNLKFLFKVIEKVAAGQLLEHLANNNLEEPFQSAYKRFHSA
jgi:hypothetical protein